MNWYSEKSSSIHIHSSRIDPGSSIYLYWPLDSVMSCSSSLNPESLISPFSN